MLQNIIIIITMYIKYSNFQFPLNQKLLLWYIGIFDLQLKKIFINYVSQNKNNQKKSLKFCTQLNKKMKKRSLGLIK